MNQSAKALNISNFIYINFYSTGALIATLFNIAVALFFLIMPKRSKATTSLILIYFFIMIQNAGYLITSTVYHPLSAYHRWLTVFSVVPGLIYIANFFFNFPEERNPRARRAALIIQWTISIVIDAVFVIQSLQARKVFRFDGHYWDFDLDPLSYGISLILICFIVFCIITAIWRLIVEERHNKKPVMYMIICFLVVSVLPGIANSLSRAGLIPRDVFQVIWNMVTVLGFFLTVTVYINITRNRTTIMANIVGISLVVFLVVFQGLSYFTSIEREESYDIIQKQKMARVLLDADYRPNDIRYLVRYAIEDTESGQMLGGDPLPSMTDVRSELANTLMYEKISVIPETRFRETLAHTVSQAHPHFRGYGAAIMEYAASLPQDSRNIRRLVMDHIDGIQRMVAYHRFAVTELPGEHFRRDLLAYLDRTDRSFAPFKKAIKESMASTRGDGDELREEALRYLAPMNAAGLRRYRQGIGDEHFVSFTETDRGNRRVYEAGFSYFDYRRFIHDSSVKLIYVLGGVIILVMVGFPLFFSGALVHPLKDLLTGVRRVDQGNLEAAVPVKMEDEIGFLAGAFNKMVASVRDSNEKIDYINHYLKNIIDSMPSVVVGVDAAGKVTHWNMAAEQKTGKNEESVIGLPMADVFPLMGKYTDSMLLAISNKEPQKLEKIVQREKNEITYHDLLIYPLIADGVEGAVIRIDDVTSRVRLEKMMIQTEKMMSVGGLAAGMAHEINNPLSGILLATQNIQRRLDPGNEKNIEAARETGVDLEKMTAYLRKRDIPSMIDGMREMGERASRIVNNMLSFSRRSESKKDMISLPEMLDKTIELAASDYDLKKSYDFRHIEIAREYEEGLPPVECVAVEIQQVLLNLLRNAAQAIRSKHYPPGESARITLRLSRDGPSAVIEVEDSGPGMTEDLKKHIFEPFFTTKESGVGTGLGLSVSYFIITNNHHGAIAVESLPDRGTRFIITIPIRKDTA